MDSEAEHPITKAEVLRILRAEQGQWEQLIALVPTEHLEQPMTPGGWSLRDLLAHLLWYAAEGLALCRDGAVRYPEMWGRPYDAINADIWREAQTAAGVDVLDAWRATIQEIYDWVAVSDEAWLAEAVAFPGEKPVSRLRQVEINTFGHYREHVDDLRAWLEGEGKQ
ncbi:MAG: ClbS/DfsB family four-helix bundle protein [Caldilineaceae bacterium]|nr:ClbS/DfsB family four-helix bundle protein [Caldilineaceae bacterium]